MWYETSCIIHLNFKLGHVRHIISSSWRVDNQRHSERSTNSKKRLFGRERKTRNYEEISRRSNTPDFITSLEWKLLRLLKSLRCKNSPVWITRRCRCIQYANSVNNPINGQPVFSKILADYHISHLAFKRFRFRPMTLLLLWPTLKHMYMCPSQLLIFIIA